MSDFNYKDGRIWMRHGKFQPYKLLLPYGMSDLVDPTGSANPIREPSADNRRETVVTDITRSEPGLITFNLQTRLRATLNYMLGFRTQRPDFQAHLGFCGRPDNFLSSEAAIHFPRCIRGDMNIDRVAIIQGDDSPVNIAVPWSSENMNFIDFAAKFLSARTISESENLNFATFILDDCGEGFDPGDYGYVGGVFSLYGAIVWRTTDKGNTFSNVGSYAFGATESISDGVVIGEPYRHRLIVARGTADGSNPAEVAYADVDDTQTVTFVNVNVGSVDGQYITKLCAVNMGNIYATTNDGQIYKSVNGGVAWTSVKAATSNALNSIKALRDGTVLAVGANNGVFLSLDSGSTWTALSGITGTFTSCEVTPDGTLFVGNSAGELYGSADNGVSWTTLSAQGVTATSITAIESHGSEMIWIAVDTADGGRILRSVDGGTGFYLWKLAIPTNTGLNDINVVDGNFIWVVGNDGFVTLTSSNFIGL